MDDKKIIELYWNRSEEAITETKVKYGSRCRNIAYRILQNHDDTEECENDTYLTTWNLIPPKNPDPFWVFLAKIVRNLSLKKLEYNQAKKRNAQALVHLDDLSQFASLHNQMEEAIEVSELTTCLNRFLEREKEQARVIFLRKYWFFDSIEEIAKRYHMSESQVKGILFRTRNRLKIYLEKEGWYV